MNNLKIAEKLLDELNSYDQLITTNQNLVKLIDTKKELDEAKISINSNISKLKDYLKINLTSDLAPSIIEQIKLLEEVLKKENLKDINSSNEIAKEFIYIKFLEPEEKRKEEKKIAEEQKRIAEIITKNEGRILLTYLIQLTTINTGLSKFARQRAHIRGNISNFYMRECRICT